MERSSSMSTKGNMGEGYHLRASLSPLTVWALSFGCAVGWGSFVMPGTTFLPIGGPLGTVLGITLGGVLMLVVGYNYYSMMKRYPDAGGTYAYAKNVLGYDHGFMSACFIMLVYFAIAWANATALPIIFRNLLGGFFQFGYLYSVAGFGVYLGEVLLSLSFLFILGFVAMRGGKLLAIVQSAMAIILLLGVVLAFSAAAASPETKFWEALPLFPPDTMPLAAVSGIFILAPWAFVGFESIVHGAEEFDFSTKTVFKIMIAAIVAAVFSYNALSMLAIASIPWGYDSWWQYLRELDNFPGLAGLPTFYATNELLGGFGMVVLGLTVVSGVGTGLLGNTFAASRLIYAISRDHMIPSWFGHLTRDGVPRNAVLFLILVSVPIPFLGRTAISWIVDVNTIGALIAYAYTSAVAVRVADAYGKKLPKFTGIIGLFVSIVLLVYFMVPNIWSVSALRAESYLILIGWSILAFFLFRYIFKNDHQRHFGKSSIVWVALLFLIFFTSTLWHRQAAQDATQDVLENLNDYYQSQLLEHGVTLSESDKTESEAYLKTQTDAVSSSLTKLNMLQIGLITLTLFFMFNIYKSLVHREKDMEVQKLSTEEMSRVRTTFFFNMSHDIRTPMNAIIGYTDLALKEKDISPQVQEYLKKIGIAGNHLLSLINDILEMSRIQNGKMDLEPTVTDLSKVAAQVYDMFATQMLAKSINYTVETKINTKWVLCDEKLLSRVLLNLISNAYKFTPEGGKVSVVIRETSHIEDKTAYEIRVKDTGMGMSPAFAATVFDAYTRDRSADNIQGTGLGMAITKSIIDLMHGDIGVETEQGKGTEFIIHLEFADADSKEVEAKELEEAKKSQGETRKKFNFENIKLLLVEDNEVNREIAMLILTEHGFEVDTANNGREALNKLVVAEPGEYGAVLMDVQMPVMNGYDATKVIRAMPEENIANIPILAMTANAFAEDVEDAKKAGMDGHIAKPIDIDKMLAELQRVLVGRYENGREKISSFERGT